MAMYNEITVEAELTNTEYMITKNYNLLENKPQINSVELIGNKSLEDLGINPDAEENIIDTVKVNGAALTPDANKAVDVTITTGTNNGTVKVNGTDVNVKGLKSAAYTESSDYDVSGAAATVQGNVDALAVVVSGKVDKVQGKGLSTNDYTNEDKTKLAGIQAGAQVNTVTSVAGKTGAVTLSKSDVGLGNVNNTSDANKPISNATQNALNLKADTSAVNTALAGKVDKVAGKGLSENDFTDTLKDKLDGISEQANKVEITPVVTEGTTLATISIDGVDTDIKGSDIDVDDTLSPVSTNPVENKGIFNAISGVLPNITEKTVTGNPITITDGNSVIAPKKCEVEFEYTQSGEGDASPSNIRPITAVSGLSLNRDTTQSENPAKTYTATFPYECGGGKYDFASRKLTENYVYMEFDGTEDWKQGSSSEHTYFYLGLDNLVGGTTNCVFSHYVTGAVTSSNTGQNRGYVYNSSGTTPRLAIRPNLTDYPDLDSFKNYLAGQYANGTPVQLVYELATAKVTDLGGEELTLLDGTNVLWSSDDISLIYESVGEINIEVDDELSPTSENPLQNKVIYETVNSLQNGIDNIAETFSTEKAYSLGDFVMYNNILYKFKDDKSAGAWDSTKVVAIKIMDVVALKNRTDLSWEEISQIVDDGLAPEVFNIGDQIMIQWKDTQTNTSYDVPMDVVHFEDVEVEGGQTKHGMFLQWHYASPFGVQFDSKEAFYVVDENGLPAGDYYFNVPTAWGSIEAGNYQFTVTDALAEGTQLVLSASNTNASLVGTNVLAYASPTSSTALGTYAISSGNSGTSLGQLKNAGDTNINGFQRAIYGYNRWGQSALRQFLNSSADKNAWWEAQNKYDRYPSELTTKDAFMKGLPSNFLNVVKKIKVNTALNTVTDDGSLEATYDKFFIPALEQFYVVPQTSGEGSYWEKWKRQSGASSPLAQGGTYTQMITNGIDNTNTAQPVRLRSAHRNHAYSTWICSSSGYVGYNYAINSLRFAPACCI